MKKKKLSVEQKKLDTDIWIIILVTLLFFLFYTVTGKQLMNFIINKNISIVPRLLLNAGIQFGVAGLGITIVCILRKESFTSFGLIRKNIFKSIIWTIISFLPYIYYIFMSGQFDGYRPFRITITNEVIASDPLFSILGMAIVVLVWGFFEGFNYIVIYDKINKRYPTTNEWLDYGAIVCAIVCILFHPFSISFLSIVEMITIFIAIYGMLMAYKKTGNSWGAIFAFCFIWNAL